MDPNISQLPPAQSQSASTEAVPQILNLIFPADGEEGEVTRVRYSLRDDTLIATYEATTRDINPEKISDTEIYNGNVVELFVCTTARPAQMPRPYYEFEISPYNQELQVLIDKNGKFDEEWSTAKFKHSATIRPDRPGWDAVMEIPLKDLAALGLDGEKVFSPIKDD